MNTKWVEQLKRNMNQKPTEELTEIWVRNDRSQLSDEAFEAIRQLLTDRGVTPTVQNLPLSRDNGRNVQKIKTRRLGKLSECCKTICSSGIWTGRIKVGLVLLIVGIICIAVGNIGKRAFGTEAKDIIEGFIIVGIVFIFIGVTLAASLLRARS